MANLVSADLLAIGLPSYRGCLDGFEADTGLLGWALDLRAPAQSLTLRFFVDGMVLLDVKTSFPRPDVSAAIGERDIRPGFCIPASELRRLTHLVALRPMAESRVEIGTTSLSLPRIDTLPTLRAAVDASVAQRVSDRREKDLLERLAITRHDAEPLVSLPLRPFDETRIGFIEAICTEDQADGLTWIVGWTFGSDLQNTPIVLVDGRKFSGALMACHYPRVDLPAGGAGFVGIVHADWRARPTSKPIVYYGDPMRHHLMSVADLPRASKLDILHYVERHRGSGDRAGWADMHKILTCRDSWLNGSESPPDIAAGVDRLIMVPHLGCFITGWVLSYTRAIEGFALKVGASAMSMDVASLIIRPRPDLLSPFPGCGTLAERAGFTCFFPGDPDFSSLDRPLLKILLEGDCASFHHVGPDHVRRLGLSESLDALLHLFPNLETERFFPSLVVAVRREYLSRCTCLDVQAMSSSRTALVVAVPCTRDGIFLFFEEIRRNAPHHLGPDTGLILLAAQACKHGELEALFQELRDDLAQSCSLIFIPEITAAMYVLRDVLLMAGADRFCFVAANDILTYAGWAAVAEFFQSRESRALVFESLDPETLLRSRTNAFSFGCDWQVFSQLFSRLEIEIETQSSSLVLFEDFVQAHIDIVEAGTFYTQAATPGRVARLINRFGK